MAIGVIVHNSKLSDDQAEEVAAHVAAGGPVPPDGARLVFRGRGDEGWYVISVWESQDAFERFYADRLMPAYEAAGASPDDIERSTFEVRSLVAGDLTGVPQPA